MKPLIRAATSDDAEAACDVIRRSIAERCVDDHHGEPARVAAWLADKTPDWVRSSLASADGFGVVAHSDGAIVGFAMVTPPGEISLCYVAPEAQRLGAGRAMLAAVETEAVSRRIVALNLRSTETAHHFYLKLGFVDSGPARRGRFITAYPMRKALT